MKFQSKMWNVCWMPLIVAAAFLVLADPAQAAMLAWVEPTDQPGWAAFFGRMHMVFLHLPIGILIAAFVVELFGLFRRSKGYDNAAVWLLVLGAITAWIACTSGWLLEEVDAHEGIVLDWHKWLGISLAIIATIAAILKGWAVKRQWKPAADDSGMGMHPGGAPLMLSRLGLIAIMLLLPVTGHLGGNMVHGTEYLTERSPFEVPEFVERFPLSLYDDKETVTISDDGTGTGIPPIVKASVTSWNEKIQPIIDDKCLKCHNETKTKGDLRMDSLALIMKGGSMGPSIIPGDFLRSEMYIRVSVPHDDIDYMPPSGEGGFTMGEINVLAEWIREFDGDISGTPAPGEAGSGDGQIASNDAAEQPKEKTYDPILARQVADAGASVQPISQEENPHLMKVVFAFRSTPFQPGSLKALEPAADRVARLELQGSGVTDSDLADLPAMSELTYLNLKDTAITDAGLANLPEMPGLQWLNLFGTEITDAGLKELERFDSLQTVYVTGTGVSEAAVASLKEAMPDTQVSSDYDFTTSFDLSLGEPVEQPETSADASEEEADDEADSAEPVNTICPVAGAPAKAEFTSEYEGKIVAFCCNNCKSKFDADPSKFAEKLP